MLIVLFLSFLPVFICPSLAHWEGKKQIRNFSFFSLTLLFFSSLFFLSCSSFFRERGARPKLISGKRDADVSGGQAGRQVKKKKQLCVASQLN